MRTIATLALAAALLGAGACRRATQTATPAVQAETTVEVQNERFYDMAIYVSQSGGSSRTRIGMATGNSTTRLRIPRYLVQPGARLLFIADPVGPAGASRSEELTVLPGDVVSLTITP